MNKILLYFFVTFFTFTLFKDMDEVKTEVKKRAVGVFRSYMAVAEDYTPAYNAHVR